MPKPLIILVIITLVVLVIFGGRSPAIRDQKDMEKNIIWNLKEAASITAVRELDGLTFVAFRLDEPETNAPWGFAVYSQKDNGKYTLAGLGRPTDTILCAEGTQAWVFTWAPEDADASSYFLFASETEGFARCEISLGDWTTTLEAGTLPDFQVTAVPGVENLSYQFLDAAGSPLGA